MSGSSNQKGSDFLKDTDKKENQIKVSYTTISTSTIIFVILPASNTNLTYLEASPPRTIPPSSSIRTLILLLDPPALLRL